MRTPLYIDEELVAKVREVTGIHDKAVLVRLGLQALIERKAAKFLAAQGGTQPRIAAIPRRRLG